MKYTNNVFINCPFDDDYEPLFHSIVFAVHDAGFIARCALEVSDATKNILASIMRIISDCKYGIHDISLTELDKDNKLPRFNMPLELGIFFGCERFGVGKHRKKSCLVLDREPYRYQKFISDIAGREVRPHGNEQKQVIREVRNWLRTASRRTTIPGGEVIWKRFNQFERDLPDICEDLQLQVNELTFVDYRDVVVEWL
ncbi:hypothetical protein MYX64_04040 [Nitrospinae bacterium AH_259_B05_G02_I21]|nr:hypothetical protein [Nitrospinae bacterium AH_259_B05_G02_I21]